MEGIQLFNLRDKFFDLRIKFNKEKDPKNKQVIMHEIKKIVEKLWNLISTSKKLEN